MSERRSSRHKRTINYRQFIDKDSGDDDDFESSPVLSKKAKSTEGRGQKETVSSSLANRAKSLKQESEVLSGPPKKARQSRDERQFSKATEQALRDSLRAVANRDHQESPTHTPSRQGLEEGKDSDYQPLNGEEGDDCSSGYDGTSDNDFEAAAPPAPKKSKPAKTKNGANGETENTPTKLSRTETANSDEGKLQPPPKTVVETVSRTKQRSAVTTALSPLSSKTSKVLPPKSPLSGCHGTAGLGKRRLPNWTPPGPAGGENRAVTSGGTPTIRVGLSRNARVKPLHNCLPHHTQHKV